MPSTPLRLAVASILTSGVHGFSTVVRPLPSPPLASPPSPVSSPPFTLPVAADACPTEGEFYYESTIRWTEGYDKSDDSFYYRDIVNSWPRDIEQSRYFRTLPAGKTIYNYRNKVLMGMAQSRILNNPPSVTPKDAVSFELPNVTRPATDEGVMMLSVLEMQSLLRSGQITATELTNIALAMLQKYDAEYNFVEVPTFEIALEKAAEADAKFAAGQYDSFVQGIPFAIKDTFDLSGYATAFGSWQFLDNVITESESPLATYAMQAGAIPLFKSSVPQLTYGTANFNGTVYSCLHGGYSAGPGDSGGSSIGSGTAVCLGVVPVAICEQTGSSCQAPALGNGISTMIPALGTFTREGTGLYSLETDRPGLFCRDVMSCAVMYNYMRGASPGDPQSRDVPFEDPSAIDLSTLSIGFTDNSNTTAWPWAFDTPFNTGQRRNVYDALVATGANVTEKTNLFDHLGPMPQMVIDLQESGLGFSSTWDHYWLNVEAFYETIFKYGGPNGTTYAHEWHGQNFNGHNGHVGASAYAVLDNMWITGYVAELGVYEMLQGMPDVVVHFGQSELTGEVLGTHMYKRAGINTVHFPEFYFNSSNVGDWVPYREQSFEDKHPATPHHAAMITCESKKYEPAKALAVCSYLQRTLVEGGKLISPNKDFIHTEIMEGRWDLDCPYDWSDKPGYEDYPDGVEGMPEYLKERIKEKYANIGVSPLCRWK